jgi:hypothetical protein
MKLFLLFLIITPFIGFSQATGYMPGYLVINNGDTVNGLIKHISGFPYQVLFREIKYKDANGKNKKTYASTEVKAFQINADSSTDFHIDSEFYVSMKFLSDSIKDFVKVEIEGTALSYYSMIESVSPGQSNFFKILKKKNGSIYYFVSNAAFIKFKKNITEFLSDAPELCNKIINGVYGKGDLVKIVDEYNSLDR